MPEISPSSIVGAGFRGALHAAPPARAWLVDEGSPGRQQRGWDVVLESLSGRIMAGGAMLRVKCGPVLGKACRTKSKQQELSCFQTPS